MISLHVDNPHIWCPTESEWDSLSAKFMEVSENNKPAAVFIDINTPSRAIVWLDPDYASVFETKRVFVQYDSCIVRPLRLKMNPFVLDCST